MDRTLFALGLLANDDVDDIEHRRVDHRNETLTRDLRRIFPLACPDDEELVMQNDAQVDYFFRCYN